MSFGRALNPHFLISTVPVTEDFIAIPDIKYKRVKVSSSYFYVPACIYPVRIGFQFWKACHRYLFKSSG